MDFGRECRRAGGFELRRADSGLVTFRGYASVTEHPYDVYGGPADGGWTETVARGAFKRSLGISQNRALMWAHDNQRVLATTRTGALRMVEDEVGLLVEADLNTRVSWIADLVEQLEDGTQDEMSIGFIARGQKWNKSYTERTITEAQVIETTIVWAGANPATVGAVDRHLELVGEARASLVVPQPSRAAVAAAATAAALAIA